MLKTLWKRKAEVRNNWLVQSLIAGGTKDQISWLLDQFSNSCLIGSWAFPCNWYDLYFWHLLSDHDSSPTYTPDLHTHVHTCMCSHIWISLPPRSPSYLENFSSLLCPQTVFPSRTKWEMKAVGTKETILMWRKKCLRKLPESLKFWPHFCFTLTV